MKFKILIAAVLVFALMGFACASFTAENGIFIYKEVENYTLNGFNFTVPIDYELSLENDTALSFDGANDTLTVTVIKDGVIEKVNTTKNVTADETMFGSVEGYLVNNNGTYTFSYVEDDYLISASSKDMTLMMGVLGLD